jgi:hypothetical protein
VVERARPRPRLGADPFIGRGPIAPLDGIGEDARGAFYFGRMFATVAAREIAPLLEARALGSSFRFSVDKMRAEDRPARSDFNPERLPQRTILAARLLEIGPTPFAVTAARRPAHRPGTIRRARGRE